jgi:multisubunit Na+/H+ antiporter MnhG subunit
MPDKPQKLTTMMCKDAGLALVLISLLCYQAWPRPQLMLLAIVCLLIAMTCPGLFKPFARIWFGLSSLLGTGMSRILLSILFVTLVLPVGLLRRAMGKDSMQIKRWKRDGDSIFQTRDHEFTADDLEHPY